MADSDIGPRLFQLLHKLQADIKARSGREVTCATTLSGRYAMKAPLLFADAWRQKRRLRIANDEEWSRRAAVTQLADERSDTGWFGKPCSYWHIELDDNEGYQKRMEALTEVCKARHERA